MIDRDPVNPDEKRLWERSGAASDAPSGPCPSLVDLAAFVDGRATGDDRDRVEAHLADCGACLHAVRATGALLREHGDALAPTSPAVVAAARALVREPGRGSGRTTGRPDRVPGLGRTGLWPTSRRWGLAAAAVLMVCSLGYLSGTGSFAGEAVAADDLLGEMTFGLYGADAESDPELELFASSVIYVDEETGR